MQSNSPGIHQMAADCSNPNSRNLSFRNTNGHRNIEFYPGHSLCNHWRSLRLCNCCISLEDLTQRNVDAVCLRLSLIARCLDNRAVRLILVGSILRNSDAGQCAHQTHLQTDKGHQWMKCQRVARAWSLERAEPMYKISRDSSSPGHTVPSGS